MELNPSQLEELKSFSIRNIVLPTQSSILATEQSRLLFNKIQGDDWYRENLNLFSKNLLNDLVQSNPSLRTTVQKHLLEHRAALAVIVHSLAHVVSHPTKYKVIAVSLNANDYRPKGPFGNLSYQLTRRLIAMLTAPELGTRVCWLKPGAYDRTINQGVRTRLMPYTPLKDQLTTAGLIWATHPRRMQIGDPEQNVFIKDIITGEVSPIARQIRDNEQVLQLVNARLREAHFDVLYPDYQRYLDLWDFKDGRFTLNTGGQIYRQFVGDDKSGGRLSGHCLQNLPKVLRQYLRINGSPVFEYDYQAMQLALAYDAMKDEPPEGDLYSIPGYEEHRDLFKACFTSAIGTNENHALMSVFSNAIHTQTGSRPKEGQVHELATAFWGHHKPIRRLANTEAWKPLQFAESEIMLDILGRLENLGITAIPLHDAVIVPVKDAGELSNAMILAVAHMKHQPPVLPAKWTVEAYPQL